MIAARLTLALLNTTPEPSQILVTAPTNPNLPKAPKGHYINKAGKIKKRNPPRKYASLISFHSKLDSPTSMVCALNNVTSADFLI
jgi:hypothetical protein